MKNELRIIGGTWRSRKLRFPDAPGLRPTADRVRETLFNWLGQNLEELTCLDLFAGSGALGFEAASRGARRVVMVEQAGEAVQALKSNCDLLAAKASVQLVQMDARRYLQGEPETFDVVFLDPPFHMNLLPAVCQMLEVRGWLAAGSRVYLESESDSTLEGLPENWHSLRAKKAGDVAYRLYQKMS